VNFLDHSVVAGTVLSVVVGATMIPTAGISAAIGAFAPAFLSSAIAKIVVKQEQPREPSAHPASSHPLNNLARQGPAHLSSLNVDCC
jgi:hypothetical protein